MVQSATVRVKQLRPVTVCFAALLTAWFALDIVGWPGLVDREPVVSLAGLMLALMLLFILVGACRVSYVSAPYTLALAAWALLQWQTHWSSYLASASDRKLN